MPKSKNDEPVMLYVMRRADGSVRAELELTATEARKINERLDKANRTQDRWELSTTGKYDDGKFELLAAQIRSLIMTNHEARMDLIAKL